MMATTFPLIGPFQDNWFFSGGWPLSRRVGLSLLRSKHWLPAPGGGDVFWDFFPIGWSKFLKHVWKNRRIEGNQTHIHLMREKYLLDLVRLLKGNKKCNNVPTKSTIGHEAALNYSGNKIGLVNQNRTTWVENHTFFKQWFYVFSMSSHVQKMCSNLRSKKMFKNVSINWFHSRGESITSLQASDPDLEEAELTDQEASDWSGHPVCVFWAMDRAKRCLFLLKKGRWIQKGWWDVIVDKCWEYLVDSALVQIDQCNSPPHAGHEWTAIGLGGHNFEIFWAIEWWNRGRKLMQCGFCKEVILNQINAQTSEAIRLNICVVPCCSHWGVRFSPAERSWSWCFWVLAKGP